MASPPTPERVEFVEYVLAGGTGTCVGVFQADAGAAVGHRRGARVDPGEHGPADDDP